MVLQLLAGEGVYGSSCTVNLINLSLQTILAGEELTYAYGWVYRELKDRHMRCLCGAPGCIGNLFGSE